ncbi:MAG: electron transfer flavoprotein subunit alpha/FixB family protein, partial [Anaerolineales bacterium]
MSNDIFVITEHMDGKVSDVSFEMVGKARELASGFGGQAIAVVLGSGADALAGSFASDSTLYVDDPALADFNPEAYGKVVEALVKEKSPRLVMFGWTATGMDNAAWLAARLDAPCITNVKDVTSDGDDLVFSSQLYGGKMMAEVSPNGETAVIAVAAGSFLAEPGQGSTAAEQMASPVALEGLKIRFLEAVKPASTDVDITAQDKLVSIGRGIGGKENIELAEELAEALEATVSASRPVVDAGWLPRTRQVGKSGLKVKPKLYLMLGISGA